MALVIGLRESFRRGKSSSRHQRTGAFRFNTSEGIIIQHLVIHVYTRPRSCGRASHLVAPLLQPRENLVRITHGRRESCWRYCQNRGGRGFAVPGTASAFPPTSKSWIGRSGPGTKISVAFVSRFPAKPTENSIAFIAVTLAGPESFRSVAGFVGNFPKEADGLAVRWIWRASIGRTPR